MDAVAREIALSVLLLLPFATTAQGATAMAWLQDGQMQWRVLDGKPDAKPWPQIPLGSLWKLFVYSYLVEQNSQEPPYRCAAKRTGPTEDDYCCEPGQSVERDAALSRSCGPYFSPERLKLDATSWRKHWKEAPTDAAWLTDLKRLNPATTLRPEQLLAALDAVPATSRRHARDALLAVLLTGYGKDAWPELGSDLRFKTFSWHDERGHALGGGAGWRSDGAPIWFAGPGASQRMLTRYAKDIMTHLPPLGPLTSDGPCAEVKFFARYPIRAVRDSRGQALPSGSLTGTIKVEFANGNTLALTPSRQLHLTQQQGRLTIHGRFAVEDYVARVVDREGSGAPREAARALALAARSYLRQNGQMVRGCWAIADASSTQRVSPQPPSAAALEAARFSADVVLQTPIRYHRDQAAPQRMAWQRAVELAKAGQRFDTILIDAYGSLDLAGISANGPQGECQRLQEAETWLSGHTALWARELRRHAGYETPGPISICRLNSGNPYADPERNRIYVRDWLSAQGRLALTHEYLHLAFRFHPNGENEDFVEQTARHLNGVISP